MRTVDKFRVALTPRSPKEENTCARYTKHGLLTLSLYVPRKHVAIRATATFSGPYTPGTTNLLVVSLYTLRERVAIRVTATLSGPYKLDTTSMLTVSLHTLRERVVIRVTATFPGDLSRPLHARYYQIAHSIFLHAMKKAYRSA